MENNQDNISRIVLKIGEQKKDLKIDSLKNIHPMYEALIALLKRQLQDREIPEKIITDDKSLRQLLAADVFLEYLPQNEQIKLKGMIAKNAPLEEIINRAAIAISNGKRTEGNNVLENIQSYCYQDPFFFMYSLKKSPPRSIYVETREIQEISKKSKKTKKRLKIAGLTAAALGLALGISGYMYKEDIKYWTISHLPVNESKLEEVTNLAEVKEEELKILNKNLDKANIDTKEIYAEYFRIGTEYSKLGKYEDSKRFLEKTLVLSPNHLGAKSALAELERKEEESENIQ